jgi:hypothetical protein
MIADAIDWLNQISEPPSHLEAFNTRLEMGNALDFLRDNSQENEFVV